MHTDKGDLHLVAKEKTHVSFVYAEKNTFYTTFYVTISAYIYIHISHTVKIYFNNIFENTVYILQNI